MSLSNCAKIRVFLSSSVKFSWPGGVYLITEFLKNKFYSSFHLPK